MSVLAKHRGFHGSCVLPCKTPRCLAHDSKGAVAHNHCSSSTWARVAPSTMSRKTRTAGRSGCCPRDILVLRYSATGICACKHYRCVEYRLGSGLALHGWPTRGPAFESNAGGGETRAELENSGGKLKFSAFRLEPRWE